MKHQDNQALHLMPGLAAACAATLLLGGCAPLTQSGPDTQNIPVDIPFDSAGCPLAPAAIEADKGPFKPTFKKQNDALLVAAKACDTDLSCWSGKLDDKDENVARKAAYMLGRLGRGQNDAITALVSKLDHPKEMVRGDVLSALDYAAISGSPEGVAKIDKIREQEEGRAIWNHVKDRALQTQAKLAARGK